MKRTHLDITGTPTNRWEKSLNELASNGYDSLTTRLYWGAHELMPGHIDLAKHPRLRIEKFLLLAQRFGFSVDLEIGFFAHALCFPKWLALTQKTLIPSALFTGTFDGFTVSEVPSVDAPSLRSGFSQFAERVSELSRLYYKPDGPIKAIHLELGIFEHDLCITERKGFIDAVTARYGTVRTLNEVYQTVFPSLEVAFSASGRKTLFQKRPWLYGYDYKWMRAYDNKRVVKEITNGAGVEFDRSPSGRMAIDSTGHEPQSDWQIAIDGTLIEFSRDQYFPFMDGGAIHPECAFLYQIVCDLCEWGSSNCRDVIFIGYDGIQTTSIVSPVLVVVCGKYLARKTYDQLVELSDRRVQVLFAHGVPQYDENLTHFEWKRFLPVPDTNLVRAEFFSSVVWGPDRKDTNQLGSQSGSAIERMVAAVAQSAH